MRKASKNEKQMTTFRGEGESVFERQYKASLSSSEMTLKEKSRTETWFRGSCDAKWFIYKCCGCLSHNQKMVLYRATFCRTHLLTKLMSPLGRVYVRQWLWDLRLVSISPVHFGSSWIKQRSYSFLTAGSMHCVCFFHDWIDQRNSVAPHKWKNPVKDLPSRRCTEFGRTCRCLSLRSRREANFVSILQNMHALGLIEALPSYSTARRTFILLTQFLPWAKHFLILFSVAMHELMQMVSGYWLCPVFFFFRSSVFSNQ